LLLDELFDVSETSNSKHDEEIVHNIGVVSLQWSTIWTNKNLPDTIKFLELVIIIVSLFFLTSCCFSFGGNASLFLLNFFSENTHSEFSKNNVDVVIELNIKLHRINGIQVTLSFFVISIDIWNGALSGQNLCHVVILNIA
jgi:hypothetical protein